MKHEMLLHNIASYALKNNHLISKHSTEVCRVYGLTPMYKSPSMEYWSNSFKLSYEEFEKGIDESLTCPETRFAAALFCVELTTAIVQGVSFIHALKTGDQMAKAIYARKISYDAHKVSKIIDNRHEKDSEYSVGRAPKGHVYVICEGGSFHIRTWAMKDELVQGPFDSGYEAFKFIERERETVGKPKIEYGDNVITVW